MKTKLTLRMDSRLITKAKLVATRQGKSVSKLVSDYISTLDTTGEAIDSLPPIVSTLYGALEDSNHNEQTYKTYLEDKHK